MSGHRAADIVLGGGGVKSIAHIGALATFEAAGYRFQRIAGTSAGAVIGALSAAGMPAARMQRLIDDLDPAQLRDASRLARLGGPGKGLALLHRRGVYDGDGLHRWLTAVLDDLGVRTFGDLRCTDDDAAHRRRQGSSRLVVSAFDASRGRLVRLPEDYRAYGLDPDAQPVADALRASCSIPGFYRPATVPTGASGRVSRLVDAGFLGRIPVDVFDRDDGRAPRWPTFGVELGAHPDLAVAGPAAPRRRWQRLTGMLRAHERWELDRPHAAVRTLWIDTAPVQAVDFGIDAAARRRLHEQGAATARRFLAGWDFDAYRWRFRGGAAEVPPAAGRSHVSPTPVGVS